MTVATPHSPLDRDAVASAAEALENLVKAFGDARQALSAIATPETMPLGRSISTYPADFGLRREAGYILDEILGGSSLDARYLQEQIVGFIWLARRPDGWSRAWKDLTPPELLSEDELAKALLGGEAA